LIDEHFDSFQQTYDERFQGKYGFWRPIVGRSVVAFLKSRGIRKKAGEGAVPSSAGNACDATPARCSQTWAMLINRTTMETMPRIRETLHNLDGDLFSK
jgi:hypothetical protein